MFHIRLWLNVGVATTCFESFTSEDYTDAYLVFDKFRDLAPTPFHMAELIETDSEGAETQIGCFVV